METVKTYEELNNEVIFLRQQLEEANETINAIRTGQIDALVVKGKQGHELYTLKTADQTYRVFIEKMTEGAITLNDHGIILYSNSKFASIVDMPLSKVIGLPFINFIAEDFTGFYNALFHKGWKEDCKGEIMLVSKNNHVPVQISLTMLQLDEGLSLSIILTDLTIQKEAQKQLKLNNDKLADANFALEASNNDLQQFAYVASHDLQEPLRKIQMYSNLLKNKLFGDAGEKSITYLDKIISSSNRMKALIVDILNYSRLSQNSDSFQLSNLHQIVEDLLDDFDMIIEEKKAVVHVEGLPVCQVTPGQMRQVFQNLISNALKFSREDERPYITIKAHKIGDDSFESGMVANGPFCYISIKDNGIGFNEQYANKIFTLFNRLHTKDKYEGTGIGLAIARKIIDKHNGRIMAKSREGEGAEFIIILPVMQHNTNNGNIPN